MKRVILAMGCLLWIVGSGCATGVPAGARTRNLSMTTGYRSFTRPAAPRPIPPAPAFAAAAPKTAPATKLTVEDRRRAVALAQKLVGKRHVRIDGKTYRDDCTGLVVGVLDQVGLDVLSRVRPGDNAVTAIYRYAAENGRIFEGGRPLPGDLVFFRETYDQNRDGHQNDGLTHIGLVEDVAEDGTVTVIHRVSRGVVRYRMNLAKPHVRRDERGRVLNDYLRHAGPGRRELLTGQLFAAYATILPSRDVVAQR